MNRPNTLTATPNDGSLTARLGLMIRHIDKHNSFDKNDLIQLLKDVQAKLNE